MMMGRMNRSKSKLTLLFLIIFASSISSLTTEFSIINGQETELLSEENVPEIFQKWKETHGKVYDNAQEEAMRLENFRKSLKYVLEKNSKRRTEWDQKVGLNRFADMSKEEFKEVYLSKVKGRNLDVLKLRGVGETAEKCDKVPPTLNWTKEGVVTSVKNQGLCDCSWAFSATGAVEAAHALSTGHLIALSAQQLVDCDEYNHGCKGGELETAYEWIMDTGGLVKESDYPYNSTDGIPGRCNDSQIPRVASIATFTYVGSTESALLCAVAKQPVSGYIDGSADDFRAYKEGIYNEDGECSSSPNSLNYMVLIVGYGSKGGKDYWIVKTSLGESWGMKGYILIERNTTKTNGICGINLRPFYPTYAPPPPPPPPPPSPPPPPPPTPSPPPPPTPSPPPPPTPSPPPPPPPSPKPPPPPPPSPPPPPPPSPKPPPPPTPSPPPPPTPSPPPPPTPSPPPPPPPSPKPPPPPPPSPPPPPPRSPPPPPPRSPPPPPPRSPPPPPPRSPPPPPPRSPPPPPPRSPPPPPPRSPPPPPPRSPPPPPPRSPPPPPPPHPCTFCSADQKCCQKPYCPEYYSFCCPKKGYSCAFSGCNGHCEPDSAPVGNILGVAAKKRGFAKLRMPWEKVEQSVVDEY